MLQSDRKTNLSLKCCIMMFINFYIARPTYCFFLMHTSGLTVVIKQTCYVMLQISNTHTHPFNSPLSGTTKVSRHQKGKTNLDFTGARDSEWQWHQLGHMQVCTSLQTDNNASTSLLKFFYRPDALPATQPTVSKH